MNVFRMKKHHAKSLRWKMNTDSFLMKSGFLFSILFINSIYYFIYPLFFTPYII